MDKQVLEAIKKHPEAAALKSYLKHIFALSKGQYPHTMSFQFGYGNKELWKT